MDRSFGSFADWELRRSLGKGGFGEVTLWVHRRSKLEIATKSLKENNRLSRDERSKVEERWLQEYQFVKNLKTQYIVGGVDVDDAGFLSYLNSSHAWQPLPVIVMEYCNGGDLRAVLQTVENYNGLQEFQVREVLRSLRHAVEYLHNTCRIEHRDLKPDNVVIHQIGRKRFYKLTDFGFARATTDETIIKSVVGTRHYFAPEIIREAKYKKNVDYWSIGVIAFELMCGVLPFIPHQDMYQIIMNIVKKPPTCIAITEKCAPQAQQPSGLPVFNFESNIFAENRMSRLFTGKMENWLQLTFDTDLSTRGTRLGVDGVRTLRFYTELDSILASKVLTVFHLNSYEFHCFEVSAELAMDALLDAIERETNLPKNMGYIVFPVGHERPKLTKGTTPVDLFMEEWQDTSDELNPPVMIYLVGYQCDYNACGPYISDVVKRCMNLDAGDTIPDWFMEQFERHAHFLLSNEQRHLTAYLSGLKEYAITVEHEMLEYKAEVKKLTDDILFMRGIVSQFATTVGHARRAHEKQLPNHRDLFAMFEKQANQFSEEINQISTNVGKATETRYNSALRRIKQQATNQLFDEWCRRDIYSLASFREHLHAGRKLSDIKVRLEVCQRAVTSCLDSRYKFLKNIQLESARTDVVEVHREFIKIRTIVDDVHKYFAKLNEKISEATYSIQTKLRDSYIDQSGSLGRQMQSLRLDEASQYRSNGVPQSLDSICDLSTDRLIMDALDNVQNMEVELDESRNYIPATVPVILSEPFGEHCAPVGQH